MVDFKKKLAAKKVKSPVEPIALYDTLDRAVDKGPLRPAQAAVLGEWHKKCRKQRDVIVKLHTGQGKTLIGLLMLQARLNEGKGPALYLCPNLHLVEQTLEQAGQFGIRTCVADPELPDEFVDGKAILVTSAQKLFNGLTRFGLHTGCVPVGTLMIDDAHACSDAIRNACRIRVERKEAAYQALLDLFARALEQQGLGTHADIQNGKYDALLPVPYWAWSEHEADVAHHLSKHSGEKSIRFTWPLLKDSLADCQCIVSGAAIEIEPYVPPLDAFGSYWDAEHRVFMSATVTDDAFLVKGLRLHPDTIDDPLTYDEEHWSGEKMVLIPSLIDDVLTRSEVVNLFARPNTKRKYGVVALTPSFKGSQDWKKYGATVADKTTVSDAVDALLSGKHEKSLVLVNRYDGIDLPDAACRVLVFDSRPYSESLVDLYHEGCRPTSDATLMRTVRTVEQGFGRSVRGEKDYSVVVMTGTELTRLVRDKNSRKFLSSQMNTQIEIGLDVAEMAQEEIDSGKEPGKALGDLIRQCLNRDDGWKAFYAERMEAVEPSGVNKRVLELYSRELEAEQLFQSGDHEGATKALQKILDEELADERDRAWFLQEMARYSHSARQADSRKLQRDAFLKNKLLLKPEQGVAVKRLTIVSEGRMERIAKWVGEHEDYEQLIVAVGDILSNLAFGVKADSFERALDELSAALGFKGERPDKEWKEGPDNLWAVGADRYILWECKNEVSTNRTEIKKAETDQMNRSWAWFKKHYPGTEARKLMVIPTHKVGSSASFLQEVEIVRKQELERLVRAVRKFFQGFEAMDLQDLSLAALQKLVDSNKLSLDELESGYGKQPRNLK
ncbi:MAG: DEAD/DEAH box helicase family protein [bacterium]|nr:DEAD/DEAH box helicase family protein [bacterium]